MILVKRNFGRTNVFTPTTWAKGDAHRNGQVDMPDYASWFNNYGAGQTVSTAPEPASLALLIAGPTGLLRKTEATRRTTFTPAKKAIRACGQAKEKGI